MKNFNLSDDFNRLHEKGRRSAEKFQTQSETNKKQQQSQKVLVKAAPGIDYTLFGDRYIPLNYPFHALLEGRTGAGKTHLLERYLLSVYFAKTRHRKYFFQLHTKNDDTDLLIKGLCQRHDIEFLIYRLDMITPNSFAIDIARSMNGKALRFLNFSKSIFIDAHNNSSDPFWHLSAELIVFNLLRGLHEIYGNDYGLHHLVDLGLGTIPLINRFLSETERGKQVSARFTSSKESSKTTESILATISAYIQGLEAAAAIQAQLPQSRWYSLKELISGHSKSVFIYSPSEYQYATQKPVHALFNWLVPEITALADQRSEGRHGFITIDELGYWGKVPLLRIAELSRSVGFHLVVAYQNRQSLEAIYDKELASILGNTTIKCLFTPTDSRSAKAFIEDLGENREYVTDYSFSQGSFSRSIKEVTRPPLTTGQIMRLEMASPTTGLNFWMSVPEELGYLHRVHLSPQEIDRQMALIESIKASTRQRSLNPSARPKQFTFKEQFQVLKTMLNSEQNYQLFMQGYEKSPIAPIRRNVWYTVSNLVNANVEDLFEFIAQRIDENY